MGKMNDGEARYVGRRKMESNYINDKSTDAQKKIGVEACHMAQMMSTGLLGTNAETVCVMIAYLMRQATEIPARFGLLVPTHDEITERAFAISQAPGAGSPDEN